MTLGRFLTWDEYTKGTLPCVPSVNSRTRARFPLSIVRKYAKHDAARGPDTSIEDVVLYRDDDGTVPILEWLDGLPPKAGDLVHLVKIENASENWATNLGGPRPTSFGMGFMSFG